MTRRITSTGRVSKVTDVRGQPSVVDQAGDGAEPLHAHPRTGRCTSSSQVTSAFRAIHGAPARDCRRRDPSRGDLAVVLVADDNGVTDRRQPLDHGRADAPAATR